MVGSRRISKAALELILASFPFVIIADNGKGFCHIIDDKPNSVFGKGLNDIEDRLRQGDFRNSGVQRRERGVWQIGIPYSY